jgi:hypothetical protein
MSHNEFLLMKVSVLCRLFTLTKKRTYKYEFMPTGALIIIHLPSEPYLCSLGSITTISILS